MLRIATPDDIKSGKVTDVYFARTAEILRAKGVDKRVRAEFIVKGFPQGWDWAILAGLEEVVEVLKDRPVTLRAFPEGTPFRTFQPVLEIEGRYLDFGVLETALLGLVCQASGIATKAARCRNLAGERGVVSFGARRMHPAIAPMIERNAYVGGCDGVAVVLSAEMLGEAPMGTMPHALILLFGDTVAAAKAFDEVVEPAIRRVALIDTFQDEKFEAIRAAEAMGKKLFGVRLDTPGSRRGSFYRILEETRWELNLRGFEHVKLFVSGGIDEAEIEQLNPFVDAYGVGTSISNAPVVDFAMDIIEIDGLPAAKRGKMSGSKQVHRCGRCGSDTVLPRDAPVPACRACGGPTAPLLVEVIRNGKLLAPYPSSQEVRARVLEALKRPPIAERQETGQH